jgi:hypothetical protein
MRTSLISVGVIAVVVGGVFAGQGAGLIPGSIMTGDSKWLVIGSIIVIVGLALIVFGATRRRGDRPRR